MLLNLALVNPEGTTHIHQIDTQNKGQSSRRVDTLNLGDETLAMAIYPESESGNLASYIEKEHKFYPIFTAESLNQDLESIKLLNYEQLLELYQKVSTRWLLNNNLKSIEQLPPITNYLKDLWVKDRNSFFEELWFFLKTNLATTELSIIFHDLKELTEKQSEKGEKPKLCYSYVQGEKIPQLFEGKDKEAVLMKEYEKDFTEIFHITDYSSERGLLTACAKIDLSPILIMAKVSELNQIQQSVLIGLFNGLN